MNLETVIWKKKEEDKRYGGGETTNINNKEK